MAEVSGEIGSWCSIFQEGPITWMASPQEVLEGARFLLDPTSSAHTNNWRLFRLLHGAIDLTASCYEGVYVDVSYIFTARRYASAELAVVRCPSVRLSLCPVSVRLTHASIVSKRLNKETRKQCRTIAQGFQFSVAKGIRKIRTGSLPTGPPNASVGFWRFHVWPICYSSQWPVFLPAATTLICPSVALHGMHYDIDSCFPEVEQDIEN